MKSLRYCKLCGKLVSQRLHGNSQFCSDRCRNKSRYARQKWNMVKRTLEVRASMRMRVLELERRVIELEREREEQEIDLPY